MIPEIKTLQLSWDCQGVKHRTLPPTQARANVYCKGSKGGNKTQVPMWDSVCSGVSRPSPSAANSILQKGLNLGLAFRVSGQSEGKQQMGPMDVQG